MLDEKKLMDFVQSKCYEVIIARDAAMHSREEFNRCAAQIKSGGNFYLDTMSELANKMRRDSDRYHDMMMFLSQLAHIAGEEYVEEFHRILNVVNEIE